MEKNSHVFLGNTQIQTNVNTAAILLFYYSA